MIYEVLPSRYGIDVRHLRQADAIELTIGQGAKPGTGGLLLGLEGLRRDRPAPRPAPRRRSALALPAPRFPRPRRHGDQDRGAPRGDRLAGADLRQDGGLARLRRRPPRRQGRAPTWSSSTAWKGAPAPRPSCSRSTPASPPWPPSARPGRRSRTSASSARSS